MKASKQNKSCDDVRMDVVLFGDETSAEFQEYSEHVESCPNCQSRLSQAAASDGEREELLSSLRENRADIETGEHGSMFIAKSGVGQTPVSRRINLDFLAAPSHPEMLGRLGRYEIEQVIGAGGMGIVLKGFDTELHRPVAIKVLAPHLAHSGAARQRFAREARLAASIVHEHVVAIHDVQSEQQSPYLVMEYVPGWSLQDRVEQDGPLSPPEILRIGMQAAAGLAAAHQQGVIHRDVKPANILLGKGVERAMLTDFGLARAADDATLTHSGIIAGTPHYMSPEQARGEQVDARSDLFSLGAVLYFMSTGHPPFRAEHAVAILHRICHDQHRGVQTVNAEIPDALADIIDRLLEKKSIHRYATASDVQQELAKTLNELQQPRRWHSGWKRKLRRRRRTLATVACTLAAVVGIGWIAISLRPATPDGKAEKTQTAQSTAAELTEQFKQQRIEENALDADFIVAKILTNGLESKPFSESVVSRPADLWMAQMKSAEAEIAGLEAQWSTKSTNNSSLYPYPFKEQKP